MSLLLYINGQLADLDAGQVIAQTKQVNDLNSLENRQASYTNKFKLPKTANNIRIMNFLTLAGNDSNIPYQKNECSLYSDSGECFVYNGWAVITDGGANYEAVVYDGIIDLYKAIENKSLADLTLGDELTHEKNIDTVKATWVINNTKKYKYILADYNGKAESDTSDINIDYLAPSVRVAWLWDEILTQHGFGYSGKVFESEDFNNLWMTYPKGIPTVENEELLFESSDYSYLSAMQDNAPYIRKYLAKFNDTTEYDDEEISDRDKIHLTVSKTGKYKLEVSGKLNTKKYVYTYNGDATGTIPSACRIIVGKNAQDKTPLTVTASEVIASSLASNTDFSKTLFITLNEGDSICLGISATEDYPRNIFSIDSGSSLNVKLIRIEPGVFDFDVVLSDFSMRDFLNEIVHRFGLTLYKDKYSNQYTFLTLKELLQESAVDDWSRKFVKKTSENYMYGNYARQNWLRYNYNEKESTHNDGCITVQNANLAESRDIIKSKIYSPEKNQVDYLSRKTSVYKLWDKEVIEDPEPGQATMTYKPLDKRYYFLRAVDKNELINISSDMLMQAGSYFRYAIESFADLSFTDIQNAYYTPIQQILNKACIVTAELFLKDTDIVNFDFKKRYYIEQLGGYFIMNKINNYVPGKPVKCELIRVQNDIFEPFKVKITKIATIASQVKVYYQTNVEVNGVVIEYLLQDSGWVSLPWEESSPAIFILPPGGYTVRIRANGQLSNSVDILMPSIQVINIP